MRIRLACDCDEVVSRLYLPRQINGGAFTNGFRYSTGTLIKATWVHDHIIPRYRVRHREARYGRRGVFRTVVVVVCSSRFPVAASRSRRPAPCDSSPVDDVSASAGSFKSSSTFDLAWVIGAGI